VRPFTRKVYKKKGLRFTRQAIRKLQAVVEAYLEGRFRDTNLLAFHAGRKTIRLHDWLLVECLRGLPCLADISKGVGSC
jgi:histone H3/H4